ncbi:MAG: hypothetical protein II145_01000, partial [Selenomonas sp.]|nr:hypothetical protein [Selenomonas sp.]
FVLSQDQTLHKRAVSASALTDILVICQQANNIHFDFMAQIIFLVHLRRDVKEIAIATSNLVNSHFCEYHIWLFMFRLVLSNQFA